MCSGLPLAGASRSTLAVARQVRRRQCRRYGHASGWAPPSVGILWAAGRPGDMVAQGRVCVAGLNGGSNKVALRGHAHVLAFALVAVFMNDAQCGAVVIHG